MAKKKKKGEKNSNYHCGIDSKLVAQRFRGLMSSFESMRPSLEESYCYKDYDPVRVERRIKAVCSAYPEMRKHVGRIPQDAPNSMSLDDAWMLMNSGPHVGVDLLEESYRLCLGAAIWILDQIQLSEKSEELHLLIKDYEVPIGYCMDVFDLAHSEEDIWAVYDILRQRNKDCTGLNTTQSDPYLTRIYMDVYTCSKQHWQDVPSRKLFEKIIALIPTEAYTHAVSAYKNYFWKWVKHYFDSFAAITQERNSSYALANQDVPPLSYTDGLTITKQMLAMEQQELRFESESDREIHIDLLQALCSERFYYICRKDAEISDIWSDFQIEDPYEACFGFLATLDSGSDLPWLYGPSSGVYHAIGLLLPWALPETAGLNWMEKRERCDYLSKLGAAWNGKEYQQKLKTLYRKESQKWYEISFQDDSSPKDIPDLGLNMAQRLYRMNDCLFPRGNSYLQDLFLDLERSTAYPEDNEFLLIYAYILGIRKYREVYEVPDEDCLDEEQESAEQEKSNLLTEIARSREHIAELEQKLENFKNLNDAYKQEIKELTQNCSNYEHEAHLNGVELKDLREAVFQKEVPSEAVEAEPAVTFPQHTNSGIVVYGGHPSWLKVIKSNLPDVNFIGAETIPNEDLIRHAKEIWIQTNALSHKTFYKIINLVRSNHIPLHYFAYASATKCAIQLLQETETKDL